MILPEKTISRSHLDPLKEAPASHHEYDGERGKEGQTQNEMTREEQHGNDFEDDCNSRRCGER